MPTVPSRRIQTVEASGVRPAFKSAAGATSAAFGGASATAKQKQADALKAASSGKLTEASSTQQAGLAEARGLQGLGQGLVQTGDTMGQIILRKQIADNEREAKDLDYKYSVALRSAGHGDGTKENPGFYATRGQNTVDTRKAAEESINKTRAALLESASNSRVKDMFNQASLIRTESELVSIARHTSAQAKVANDNVSDARISSAISDAVLDPWGKSSFAMQTIKAEMDSKAENNGWDKEVREVQEQNAVDLLASQTVEGFLSRLEISQAEKYLKTSTDAISGAAQTTIKEQITRASNQRLVSLTVTAKNMIDIWDSGKQPDATSKAALASELDQINTPRAKVIKEAMKVAEKDYVVVHDHKKQSLPAQAAANAALNAVDPTPEQHRQLGKMQKATAAMQKDVADGNGMLAAAEAGMIVPLAPVSALDPGSLEVRSAQHDAATAAMGVAMSPLNKAETTEAVRIISGEPDAAGDEPPIANSVSALNNLVSVFGPDKAAAIASDVVKDAPEVAAVMTVTKDRPDIAESILAGGRFARKNPNVAVSKAVRVAEVDAVIGNAFPAGVAPGARAAYAAAADGYYAFVKSKSGDLAEDATLYREAVEAVTGGIITRNGQSFQAPVFGMPDNQVNDIMDRISDDKLIKHGNGVPVFDDGSAFTADNIDEAMIRTSGPGFISIEMPGSGPVMNEDGSLYEFNFAEYNGSGTTKTDPRRDKPEPLVEPGSFRRGGLGEIFEKGKKFDETRQPHDGGEEHFFGSENLTEPKTLKQFKDELRKQVTGGRTSRRRGQQNPAAALSQSGSSIAAPRPIEEIPSQVEHTTVKGATGEDVVSNLASAFQSLKNAQAVMADNASGEEVVELAAEAVDDVFPGALQFMKRVAAVESNDGRHRNTFRKQSNGGALGIGQLDKNSGFKETKNTSSHPVLKRAYAKIEKSFGIDWAKVKFDDMRKPLYSLLAMRLFLLTKPGVAPDKLSLQDQARLWKTDYNTEAGEGTVERFIEVGGRVQ